MKCPVHVRMCIHVCRAAFFIGPVKGDDLPKDAEPGCTLTGTITLAKTGSSKGDGTAPTKCDLVYTVPAPKKRKDDTAEDSSSKEEEAAEGKSPEERVAEARRDADVRTCDGSSLIGHLCTCAPVGTTCQCRVLQPTACSHNPQAIAILNYFLPHVIEHCNCRHICLMLSYFACSSRS